jgi:hypothetical protein
LNTVFSNLERLNGGNTSGTLSEGWLVVVMGNSRLIFYLVKERSASPPL